jgi:hypothetical protein
MIVFSFLSLTCRPRWRAVLPIVFSRETWTQFTGQITPTPTKRRREEEFGIIMYEKHRKRHRMASYKSVKSVSSPLSHRVRIRYSRYSTSWQYVSLIALIHTLQFSIQPSISTSSSACCVLAHSSLGAPSKKQIDPPPSFKYRVFYLSLPLPLPPTPSPVLSVPIPIRSDSFGIVVGPVSHALDVRSNVALRSLGITPPNQIRPNKVFRSCLQYPQISRSAVVEPRCISQSVQYRMILYKFLNGVGTPTQNAPPRLVQD